MPTEWIIVLVIGLLLLFSAKKLPDMARGLGQSMRIFKAETRGMREDDKARKGQDAPPAIAETAPGQATAQAVPPAQAQPVQAQTVQAQPVQAQPVQAQPVQAPVAQQAQPVQAQPDSGTVAPGTPAQPGTASTS